MNEMTISVRGRPVRCRALQVGGATVLLRGQFVKIAQVFDEYWMERDSIPAPEAIEGALRLSPQRPDIFVFAQRIPDEVNPDSKLHWESDNCAVLPLSTYDNWFKNQIPSTTRRNIRASEKRGITTRVSAYDDAYVQGISAIFNETPVRAGRKYWHYGKALEDVRRENGTYQARSTYIGAYQNEEMVGYLKIVWDKKTAAIMQILSKTTARDSRVNNALLAEGVRQCCQRGIEYLLYEKFDYGNKVGDSLTRFKQSNGFVRKDIRRYYVPLNKKGELAVKFGLHRRLVDLLPEKFASRLREARTKWLAKAVAE